MEYNDKPLMQSRFRSSNYVKGAAVLIFYGLLCYGLLTAIPDNQVVHITLGLFGLVIIIGFIGFFFFDNKTLFLYHDRLEFVNRVTGSRIEVYYDHIKKATIRTDFYKDSVGNPKSDGHYVFEMLTEDNHEFEFDENQYDNFRQLVDFISKKLKKPISRKPR